MVLFGAKCVFQITLVNAKLVGHHHIGIVRNALSDPVAVSYTHLDVYKRQAKMLDKTSSIICAFGLASAAPRSPYRHLELCGITFTFFMGASGAPSTDSPEGTECVEELQKKNQITGPRQWISMALKYWMASFLVISPLSTRNSLAKASSPTCSMVLSPVMIRPAFRSISFSMRW